MSTDLVCCCVVDPRDPCSRRLPREATQTPVGRRRFLRQLGSALLLPAAAQILLPEQAVGGEFVSQGIDPAKLWDGHRLRVFAYKQGEQLGELCRRLDAERDRLPVSLIWRLPPEWVHVFPTIHFEISNRHWKKYEGWQTPAHFVEFYDRYNPPPRVAGEPSPYKEFAASYDGPTWTYPGEIADHLLDSDSLHRFSKYELQSLSKTEMENLHAAHHEQQVEPGLRPPQAATLASS